MTAALALPQAKFDVAEAGQARYYLAWTRYRLDEVDAAARLFHEAATALRSAVPEIAVQAAWMHASCLVQLAAKDKRQATAAIASLHAFKQDYPTSEEAQRVDFLIIRLRQTSADPTEVIRELTAIQPADATYLSAQYELCQLRYQLWSKAKAEPAKADPLATDVLKSVDRFLALSQKGDDAERRLKAALLGVDVIQAATKTDQARIMALLNSVGNAADQVEPTNTAVVEYHYRRLQLRRKPAMCRQSNRRPAGSPSMAAERNMNCRRWRSWHGRPTRQSRLLRSRPYGENRGGSENLFAASSRSLAIRRPH